MNYLAIADTCMLDRPTGSARVAWDHAGVMRDAGHSVTLLCFRPSESVRKPETSIEEGIRVLRMDRPPARRFDPLRAHKTMNIVREAAVKNLSNTPWDIVHMHSVLPAWGAMRALGSGPRYFYTVHSPAVLELKIEWRKQGVPGRLKLLLGLPLMRLLERKILLRCSGIHALSEYVKSEIEAFHGVGDRIVVFPHWRRKELCRTMSKIDARKQLGWPLDLPVLFTVRRHVQRMGLAVAIEALAPLARAGRCKLVIGGDGPLRPSLIRMVQEKGCSENNISLPGHLSEEELLLSYQAADLFLLPTVALEGFGIISVEAMALGCPVIGTDIGATPELLKPIAPDLIVPSRNALALRRKIEDFLDGKLKIPSGEELTTYTELRFGYDAVVPKFLDFFGMKKCCI
jgi:glycosyltransferase involved in cell wall biosynthesis